MRTNVNTLIYAWNEKSKGAFHLSKALNIPRIRHNRSTFEGGPNWTVINWGSSDLPETVLKSKIVNNPKIVDACANKLTFFKRMTGKNGPRIPEFTVEKEVALEWVKEGKLVVGRTQLRARSGAGIVFFDTLDDFVKAPLYTEYIKKREEYRIHFAFGERIDVQQKLLRQTDEYGEKIDPSKIDFRVRSHANGFIFAKNNLIVPRDVLTQAESAFNKSGLDFGAVDVLYNQKQDKAYVLEINTAPGIEGSTIESYATAFNESLS